MPSIQSTEFGQITFHQQEVFQFPEGLHGFEDSKEYVVVEREGLVPFCFLQSVSDAALRFICLPACIVDASFVVNVGPEDASELNIAAGPYAPSAPGVQVLAILTIPEHGPATANLFAPIVLALATRRGRQCIQFDAGSPASTVVTWAVRHDPRAVA